MIKQFTKVNFPNSAKITRATASDADMGSKFISATIRIDRDEELDFSDNWEIIYNGERYIGYIKNPQAVKENVSLFSQCEVTFYHYAVYELQRYFFVEMTSVEAGVYIPNRFIAPLTLNIQDFVLALNHVLDYWYKGNIVAQLQPASYDTTATTISISNSYIWDVLQQIYEVYKVRWTIETERDNGQHTGRYIIKIGYGTDDISHIFEYGFKGGLLKYEQQQQSDNMKNVLYGRGGEKNLPRRYFKQTDSSNVSFAPDPDWISELANVPFTNLLDINFRYYVQGWKDRKEGKSKRYPNMYDSSAAIKLSYVPWAYTKGYTDETFNPTEYVKDDESISKYGVLMGGLDDNDDIYPTIQGVTVDGIGRVDQVVDVQQVESDTIDGNFTTQSEATVKYLQSFGASVKVTDTEWHHISIKGDTFSVPSGKKAVYDFTPSLSGVAYDNYARPDEISVGELLTEDVEVVIYDYSTNQVWEGTAANLEGGDNGRTFYAVVNANVKTVKDSTNANVLTFRAENVTLVISDPKAQPTSGATFDIWIKDIWGSVRQQDETDEEFVKRIWNPILGTDSEEAKVVFTSGWLSTSEDYEFAIANNGVFFDDSKVYNGVPSMWRLRLIRSDADFDSLGVYIPSTQRQGSAGDTFFFTGIDMPHQYVVWAEQRLNDNKNTELSEVAEITPTRVVTFDKIRMQQAANSEDYEFAEAGERIIDTIKVGSKMRVADKQFTNGAPIEQYIQSIEYTFEPDKLLPEMTVVLSNEVAAVKSSTRAITSEISALWNYVGGMAMSEDIIRVVGNKLFLRKDGLEDLSASPTRFSKSVTSSEFRQGIIGGRGWGMYFDENGNSVFECDKLLLRQSLEAFAMIVHQVEYVGGKRIESAASMECTSVTEDNGYYYCYFDTKDGEVRNLFKVDDVVYSETFDPDLTSLKFYKRRVAAIGENYVKLYKNSNYNGEGIPEAGDVIIQYGNYSDATRMFVKVYDVIGGGYEVYLEGLNSVTATGTEYYFVGKQSGQNPRMFIGNKSNGAWLEYKDNKLTLNCELHINSTYNGKQLSEYISDTVEGFNYDTAIQNLQNQIDGVVEAWSGDGEPTAANYPASSWTTDLERQKHIGDVYYDNSTGYAYRWFWNSASDYGWQLIGDTAASEALNLARQSVIETDVLYKATNSQDEAPALPTAENMNGWETDAPKWQSGMYIWTTTKTRYGDGTVTYSNAVMISGKDGQNGTNITIVATEIKYAKSQSGTTPPSMETLWEPSIPTVPQGWYLWTRTKVEYSDATVTTSYSVTRIGMDGESVYVSNSYTLYATTTTPQQPSDSAFTETEVPTLQEGIYLWSMTVVEYSDTDATKTYAVSYIGNDGDNGLPGTPGANGLTSYLHIAYANSADGVQDFSTSDGANKKYIGQYSDFTLEDSTTPSDYTWSEFKGNGIASIVEMYYLSTSNTVLQGGSWKTAENKDPWVAGKYYWTKSVITYTNGDVSETEPICVTGQNGADGTSVLAQYSSDGVNWHSDYQDGDVWMRTSTDGTNWTSAIKIAGENGTQLNLLDCTNQGVTNWSITKSAEASARIATDSADGIDGMKIQVVTPPGSSGYLILLYDLSNTLIQSFRQGDKYTLSFDAKCSVNGTKLGAMITQSSGQNTVATFSEPWNVTLSTEYQRFKMTCTVGDLSGVTLNAQKLYFYNTFLQVASTTYIRNLKLEKGEQDTGWNKSVSDLQGADGQYTVFQWAKNNSTTEAPTSDWQDTPMTPLAGEYVWMRSGIVVPPATTPSSWSTPTRITGDAGTNGENAVLLDLSNENISIGCDSDGDPYVSLDTITCAVTVYEGASVASGWSISKVDNGCTSSLDFKANVIQLQSLSADQATITVTATKGTITLTSVITISKVKAGANGEAAVVYSIEPSVNNVTKSALGDLSTTVVSCYKYKTTGAAARTTTTNHTLKYQRIGVDDSETTLSGTGGTVSVTTETTAIIFTLYQDDTTTILDRERVPVLSDASDLEVGATNLALGTKHDFTMVKADFAYPQQTNFVQDLYDIYGLQTGDTFTVTLELTLRDLEFGYGDISPRCSLQFNQGDTWWGGAYGFMPTDMGTHYIKITFRNMGSGFAADQATKLQLRLDAANAPTVTFSDATKVRLRIHHVMVEKGNVATSWQPSPNDFDYVTEALKQDTQISGGLIQTSMIKLGYEDAAGDYHVQAGTSGLWSDTEHGGGIAFFAGGDIVDPKDDAENAATYGVRMDGSVWAAGNTVRMEQNQLNVGDYVIMDKDSLCLIDGDQSVKVLLSNQAIPTEFTDVDNQAITINTTTSRTYDLYRKSMGSASMYYINFQNLNILDDVYALGSFTSARTQIVFSVNVSYYLSSSMTGTAGSLDNIVIPQITAELLDNSGTVLQTNTIRGNRASNASGSKLVTYSQSNIIYNVTSAGSYYLRLRFESMTSNGGSVAMTLSSQSVTSNCVGEISPLFASKTVIGNNGIVSIWPNSGIFVHVQGETKMMQGDYGIKITPSGIEKTTNGGASWTAASL